MHVFSVFKLFFFNYIIFHVFLISDEGGSGDSVQSNAEVQKLRKELQSIEEENNMLKYKVELLLDMVIIIFHFQLSQLCFVFYPCYSWSNSPKWIPCLLTNVCEYTG